MVRSPSHRPRTRARTPRAGADLRPLVWASGTAVVGTALLVVAVAAGWLGEDVGRGAEYCEAWHDGCVKQPVNTVSNLGFVLAGLLIAWRARRLDLRGDGPLRRTEVVSTLASVVVLMGPASAAMHATGTEVGGRLDLLSMHLIAGFALAYALVRTRGRAFWPTFALLVLGAQLLSALPVDVPVVKYPANVLFAAMLVAALVLEVGAWRLDHQRLEGPPVLDVRWGLAGVGVLLVAFVIWNLAQGPWCDPHSWVQGHGVWHVLCAVSCWLLHRYYASERPTLSPA